MEAPAPRAMSDAEEAHILATIDQFERFVSLTRLGKIGVKQLRNFYRDQIESLRFELKNRPRVRDFKPTPKKAEPPPPPTSCPSCSSTDLWSVGDRKCYACGHNVGAPAP